ncbi:MAG: type II toxin-antitoxin system Phd/YefM family antitoxin [Proteobacteria bacterium]|nr:type II toxin-antitoxin system Phd/YefM family antitoxin [Pseudomonadota bacterium]
MNKTWQLQEAKSKFSQLVDKAMQHGPQIVTKHGDEAVVILSIEDYKKMMSPELDLLEFFNDSPLRGLELDLDRLKDLPRDMEL